MKNIPFYFILLLLIAASCKKEEAAIANPVGNTSTTFIKYTLKKGNHFADSNPYKATDITELNFMVRFDSSAIYKTTNPVNQYDINKLYGFADNGAHHQQFSARFGWRWSDGALRLFAYVYNGGEVVSEELSTIDIGAEVTCSIKIDEAAYVFLVNKHSRRIARGATTATGVGYQLYPYFGGDEPAPHDIVIWIKAL